jgi:hypothetical protein
MGLRIVGGPWDGGLYWGGSPHEGYASLHTLPGGAYWVSEDGKRLVWHPVRRAA